LVFKYWVEFKRRVAISTVVQVVKESNRESNKVDADVTVDVENDVPNDSLLIQAFDKGLDHQKLFMRYANCFLICRYDFKDLGFKVKGATVLRGVSGRIQPGKLTAIMGPSGMNHVQHKRRRKDNLPKCTYGKSQANERSAVSEWKRM
jgi:ABC-type multidrug transport system fused ATPase/permease subunit